MIKLDFPPNFERILEVFPKADARGVLFAYGEDVYNPSGVRILPFILKHEYRHCARQWVEGADAWWERYLTDPEYRYHEELLGHVEEYKAQIALTADRNEWARIRTRTAARLVAPLYNYDPPRSLTQAMRDIFRHAH